MNYYRVKAQCGHVGKNHYISKNFYIRAESGREAASLARKVPRVKHDKKFAIEEVKKITKEQFLEGIKINNEDPYLNATSIQEQRVTCPDLYEEIKREGEKVAYKKSHIKRHLIENLKTKEWQRLKNYAPE